MPAKNRMKSFNPFLNLPGCAIRLLILLTTCVLLPAAQSKQKAVYDICLKCHNPVAVSLQKKFMHEALEEGCLTCHLDCREITPTGNRHNLSSHYLKKAEPGLCLECHTPSKKDLSFVHGNQFFAQTKCSSCHEPHASNSVKRFPDFSHGPFGVRDCAACHAAPVGGKVQLVAPNIEALCTGCHLDIKTRIEKSKSRHNIVSKGQSLIKSESSCVECHDAHATNQKYLLKKPEPDLCSRCHLNLTAGKKYVHEPVRRSCILCHDAHASDIPNDLHAPIRELCIGCHGVNAEKIMHSDQPISLFEGQVNLQPGSFERLTPLRLSSDGITGHPTEGHPVYVPAKGKNAELNCLSCHFPHAGASSPQLLIENKESLCLRCHKK
jgi:predicted CXXCH cytochrome family protein